MARSYLSARRRSRVWPTLAALVVAAALVSMIVLSRGDETNTRIQSNVNVCREARECYVTLDRLLRTAKPDQRILLAKANKGSRPRLVPPLSGTKRSDPSQGATPSKPGGSLTTPRNGPRARANTPRRVPGRSDPGSKASSQPQSQSPEASPPVPSTPAPAPPAGLTGPIGVTGIVCGLGVTLPTC